MTPSLFSAAINMNKAESCYKELIELNAAYLDYYNLPKSDSDFYFRKQFACFCRSDAEKIAILSMFERFDFLNYLGRPDLAEEYLGKEKEVILYCGTDSCAKPNSVEVYITEDNFKGILYPHRFDTGYLICERVYQKFYKT